MNSMLQARLDRAPQHDDTMLEGPNDEPSTSAQPIVFGHHKLHSWWSQSDQRLSFYKNPDCSCGPPYTISPLTPPNNHRIANTQGMSSSSLESKQKVADATLALAIELFKGFGYIVEPTSAGVSFHFSLSDPVEVYSQRLGTLLGWKPSERLKEIGDNLSIKIIPRPGASDQAEVTRKEEVLREKFEAAWDGIQGEIGGDKKLWQRRQDQLLTDLAKELDIRGGRFIIGADDSNVDRYWLSILERLAQKEREVCEVVVSYEKPPDAVQSVYVISLHIPDFTDKALRERFMRYLAELGISETPGQIPFRTHVHDILNISAVGSPSTADEINETTSHQGASRASPRRSVKRRFTGLCKSLMDVLR